ncbi:hypothetical protein EDD72_102266 [Tepidibacillus fermentans]|uniref:Uncharacterized protein n=1 Tax=Tepidibacillus fermentans TaxID=1281767 RepID=A0A4R3KL25_9BACI|nr:hypothetical protein EDD72_102266 [Tepidibacillus fermentans]
MDAIVALVFGMVDITAALLSKSIELGNVSFEVVEYSSATFFVLFFRNSYNKTKTKV